MRYACFEVGGTRRVGLVSEDGLHIQVLALDAAQEALNQNAGVDAKLEAELIMGEAYVRN